MEHKKSTSGQSGRKRDPGTREDQKISEDWERRQNRSLAHRESQEREEIRRRNRMRRKKRIRRRRICFLLVLAVVGAGAFFFANGDRPSREAPAVEEINGIPVVQALIREGTPGRPGTEKRIKYIVIHETGNTGPNANAASHAEYLMEQAEKEALSWHYTVDDHEIYHHVPDNEVAFHAGDGLEEDGGNLNGIGIELCVNPENDYERTLDNAAALTAHLLQAYKLSIENVKMHQDFSGKRCPEKLIEEGRWQEFLDMIEEKMLEKTRKE